MLRAILALFSFGCSHRSYMLNYPLSFVSHLTLSTPKDVSDVRLGLGMFGYSRKFIWGYSEKSRPLTRLTDKSVDFV